MRNEITHNTPTFDDIIISSTLFNDNPIIQAQNIINEFNKGNTESFVTDSVVFGTRIQRNEFRLVHRNNTPELLGFTDTPVRLKWYWTGTTQEIGIYKQIDLFFGGHGRYIVNVPKGKIAPAWLGNQPIFLGEGPHVIRHPNFIFRENPIDLSSEYINHGTIHILRIPKGKMAKVWFGATPYLFESREEPYIFNDPLFRLEREGNKNFVDASERLIVHGSIKRIMPKTGEVAIAYDNGKLTIISPSDKPITVDNPNFTVDRDFLSTNIQTLIFPSEKVKGERRRSNPNDLDAIEYEVFRTSDNLPIGVNLLVVYEIEDPNKLLSNLNRESIVPHIENLMVADMGRVIGCCTSMNFQNTNQTTVKSAKEDRLEDAQVASGFLQHLQDEVKNKLHDDFKEFGIHLVRVNIETPKILNKKISDQMGEYSLITAETRTKVSVLDNQFKIAQQQASQEAERRRIEQDREYQNQLQRSEANAKSQMIAAEATSKSQILSAETDKNSAQLRAEALTIENQAKLKALEQRGELFHKYPELLQVELADKRARALEKVQMVISPEVVQGLLMNGMLSQVLQRSINPGNEALSIENESVLLSKPH